MRWFFAFLRWLGVVGLSAMVTFLVIMAAFLLGGQTWIQSKLPPFPEIQKEMETRKEEVALVPPLPGESFAAWQARRFGVAVPLKMKPYEAMLASEMPSENEDLDEEESLPESVLKEPGGESAVLLF